jgi:hypothetical protein
VSRAGDIDWNTFRFAESGAWLVEDFLGQERKNDLSDTESQLVFRNQQLTVLSRMAKVPHNLSATLSLPRGMTDDWTNVD